MAFINECDCVQLLKTKLGHEDFEIEDYKIAEFDEILGFHGNHSHLKIDATVNGEKTKFTFFVKSGTTNQEVFDRYWGRAGFFYKEHIFMTKIIKDLKKQVPRKLTADCYLSKLNQFIVMENLSFDGYEVSRKQGFDLEHAKCAVEVFADFHAASLIYEEKTGTSFAEKYKDMLYETLFYQDPDREECLMYTLRKGIKAVCDKYFKYTDPKVLATTLEAVRKAATELTATSTSYRNVISQGDPWGNNVLYKYKDDKPSTAILLDFQCLRYGPPARELIQFFYLAMSKQLRISHQEELTDIYYKRLAQTLGLKNIEIDRVLPKDEFDETLKVYEPFGIAMRIYYAYITKMPGEYLSKMAHSVPDFLGFMIEGDLKYPFEAMESHELYRKDLLESIEDGIEFFKPQS